MHDELTTARHCGVMQPQALEPCSNTPPCPVAACYVSGRGGQCGSEETGGAVASLSWEICVWVGVGWWAGCDRGEGVMGVGVLWGWWQKLCENENWMVRMWVVLLACGIENTITHTHTPICCMHASSIAR